jgi:hypothetical protein
MFKAAKDAMTSKAALHFANREIARYGKVLDLEIDSRRKTVDVSCLLAGEATPITIHVENYRIEPDGEKSHLQASGFTCNRPWLERLLADFAEHRRIELPAWAGKFLA